MGFRAAALPLPRHRLGRRRTVGRDWGGRPATVTVPLGPGLDPGSRFGRRRSSGPVLYYSRPAGRPTVSSTAFRLPSKHARGRPQGSAQPGQCKVKSYMENAHKNNHKHNANSLLWHGVELGISECLSTYRAFQLNVSFPICTTPIPIKQIFFQTGITHGPVSKPTDVRC